MKQKADQEAANAAELATVPTAEEIVEAVEETGSEVTAAAKAAEETTAAEQKIN